MYSVTRRHMRFSEGTSTGLSCEQLFQVCKANADVWLSNQNAQTDNTMIGAARRATNQFVYDNMILSCQLQEAVCISHRVTIRIAKPIAPVVDTVVYVLGAMVIIAGIVYIVSSIAPLVLVPVIAL